MTDERILSKLKDIFESLNNKKEENITENSNIFTDLGLDSIGLVYMAIIIEQTFNIDMGNIDLGSLKTVKDIVNYIKENRN